MASRFYAVDLGAQMPSAVTEGAGTAAKAVELQVDLAKITDKTQVILALEAIKNYLITRETSPVA